MPSKPIIKLEFEQAELVEIEIYKISYFIRDTNSVTPERLRRHVVPHLCLLFGRLLNILSNIKAFLVKQCLNL